MSSQEMINTTITGTQDSGLFSKVTVEHIAYLGIALLALVLRFADLGLAPLNPPEAEQALAIWDLWLPGGEQVVPSSPAYFFVTALLTQLIGFSDSVMRIIPAIFGFFLVLTPWFLRHRSGRLGALVAALLLAFSPLQSVASRTVGGQTIALFAGMLLFITWLRYQESSDRRWLFALAAALALGLTSSPLFYATLLDLVLAWLAQRAIGPALIRDHEGRRAPLVKPAAEDLRLALVIGFASFLLISTALFLAMRGLGSSADLLADWLRQFKLLSGASTRVGPFAVLARYEVGLILLGLPAAVWAAVREKSYPVFLVYWALGALLLMLIQPGSMPNVLLLSLPGYLLVGRFANDILSRPSSNWWWAFAAAILLAGGVAYLNLVRFARLAGLQATPSSSYHLLIAIIALLVVLVLSLLLFSWDKLAAAKGLITGLIALLLLLSWGAAWWLSHEGANETRERWLSLGTDVDIRLVRETIEELSWRSSNSANDAVISSAVDTPALRWYLRDFANASFSSTVPASTSSPVLITPLEYDPQLAVNYLGTEYGHLHPNTPHALDWSDALRWWLFHQSPIPVSEERLVLWLRADIVEASQ